MFCDHLQLYIKRCLNTITDCGFEHNNERPHTYTINPHTQSVFGSLSLALLLWLSVNNAAHWHQFIFNYSAFGPTHSQSIASNRLTNLICNYAIVAITITINQHRLQYYIPIGNMKTYMYMHLPFTQPVYLKHKNQITQMGGNVSHV